VVNAANRIYRRVKGPTGYADGGWQQLSGTASTIAVGADGSAWSIGPNQSIQRYNQSTGAWVTQSGQAVRISVDAQGTPWVVTAAGTLWHLQGSAWSALGDGYADVGIH
jgi:hypothetical protein